jgi:hypothetical protein
MAELPEAVVLWNTGETACFSNGVQVERRQISLNKEFAAIIDMIVCHTAFQAIFKPGTPLLECKKRWADPEWRSEPESAASRVLGISKEERIAVSHGHRLSKVRTIN